jgi:hypothetical protein
LEQAYRLEPTQVAGFNQAYRSLIPEVEVRSVSGEQFENWGLSLEQRFGTGTYLGASLEVLKGAIVRDVGITEPDPTSSLAPFVAGGTREDLNYQERNATFTVDQLIGNEWSVGARYQFSEADLRQKYPEWIAVNATPQPPARLRYHHEAILNRVTLYTVYNHPSGLFGRLESLWSWQRNFGYSPSRPGDEFWHLNAYAGYRWPRRRAEFMLGLLNATDQDFRHNPLNLTPQEAHHRTLLASFRFSF